MVLLVVDERHAVDGDVDALVPRSLDAIVARRRDDDDDDDDGDDDDDDDEFEVVRWSCDDFSATRLLFDDDLKKWKNEKNEKEEEREHVKCIFEVVVIVVDITTVALTVAISQASR